MIETKSLVKRFGDFTALYDINCTLPDGSIFGMVGSNGAGKSTFLRIVTGVYRADEGLVLMDGEPIYENPKAKAQIAYIPDDLYFLGGATLDRMASAYKSLFPNFSKERYEYFTKELNLPRNKSIATFSKGMKRQAVTALALATCPKYIFFDETFDGMDPVVRSYVKKLICRDVYDRGASAVITSHSLRELEDTCDRLALLHKGGIVLQNEVQNLKTRHFKVQIAFKEPFDAGKFSGLKVDRCSINGSVANLIVNDEREKTLGYLESLNPVLCEVLPLTLEEVFTFEMEALGYTFNLESGGENYEK